MYCIYAVFHKAVILKAIRHWESRTCLTFIPKRSSDRNYVSFYKGSCGSVVCLLVDLLGNYSVVFLDVARMSELEEEDKAFQLDQSRNFDLLMLEYC